MKKSTTKKVKTYVLIVSRHFPAYHPRKGQDTGFLYKLGSEKKHTIRGNYALWKKRIGEVNRGEAILSIRYWSGLPYKSKQLEYTQYNHTHGIGVQRLNHTYLGWFINEYDSDISTEYLAGNDGLSLRDFQDWFKGKVPSEAAIIHFTAFRYDNNKNDNKGAFKILTDL